MNAVKGLVLCGGFSRRMGHPKATLEFNGVTLVDRAFRLLGRRCEEVWISVAQGQEIAVDQPRLVDRLTDIGPMGGLDAAQRHDPEASWLVLAVDMPLVDEAVLEALTAERAQSREVTAFWVNNRAQPLCAVYEPRCAAAVGRAVASKQYSLSRLLSDLNVTWLATEDPRLVNVNDAADWSALGRDSTDPAQRPFRYQIRS